MIRASESGRRSPDAEEPSSGSGPLNPVPQSPGDLLRPESNLTLDLRLRSEQVFDLERAFDERMFAWDS